MITTQPRVDETSIASFLHRIFDCPAIQDKYMCIWTLRDKRSRYFAVADMDDAAVYAAERAQTMDVYVRTTLLDAPMDEYRRGRAEDTTAITGLWLDVDIADAVHKKKRLPTDVETAKALLGRFGVEPSILIHSGHGLQSWILLDKPLLIDSDSQRKQAQEFVADYQATMRQHAHTEGYELDSTHDLARVFRIAGCLNHKCDPVSVELLQCDDRRYSLEQIQRHLLRDECEVDCGQPDFPRRSNRDSKGKMITEDQCSSEPLKRLKKMLEDNERLSATWHRSRSDLNDDSPSGYDLALASMLGHAGFGDEDIVSALCASRELHGDETAKLFHGPNGNGRCYQLDTLRKARSRKPQRTGAPSFALTDLGNAERLAAHHGQDLKYVRYRRDKGDWYVWNDQHWTVDNIGAVQARAKATVRGMYAEASETQDDTHRGELVKHARRSEGNQRITAMINLARSENPIPIPSMAMDNQPWLLNVRNGTIDLRTGTLHPHSRDDYLTKLCDVMYDSGAECPRWRRFLDEIMAGNQAIIGFLQRLMGMCLTGDISEHIFVIFYGAGRNGKNTFLDVFMDFLGDYAMPAPASLLTTRRNGSEHPTDVASLWGKRLVVASETDEGAALKVSLVKNLTGDRFIEARFMHQDNFTFARTHKTILMTNNRPIIRERSDAIWERVKLVPFTQQFTGSKADKRLPETLKKEYPGILAWAVEGCLKWQREQSLAIPPEVTKATDDYQAEEDQVAAFIEDCCTVNASRRCTRKEIWESYTQWVKEIGEKPVPQKPFYERMRAKGFEDQRFRFEGSATRGFVGIAVTNPVEALKDKPEVE